MENNILNIIDNNQFLLKLFPKGIDKFAFGNLDIKINNRIYFNLHTSQKPEIIIDKWGEWNKNYNVIVIEIIAQFIDNLEVFNVQKNKLKVCKFDMEIDKTNNEILILKFSNRDWFVKLNLKSLTFQRCSIYINDYLIT